MKPCSGADEAGAEDADDDALAQVNINTEHISIAVRPGHRCEVRRSSRFGSIVTVV